MTPATITIPRRFHGPPDSGNGGYVCGRLAAFVVGAAPRVRLKLPPPLETDLQVEHNDGGVQLLRGGEVIAQGFPEDLDLEIPAPVSIEEATLASTRFVGLANHVFPTCFVCGPDRNEGDGLRIFPGAVPGRDLVASIWTPHGSLSRFDSVTAEQALSNGPSDTSADARELVADEHIWAALDCPGGFSFDPAPGNGMLLGELCAEIHAPVQVGEPHVLIGWEIEHQGRKHRAGTALFDGNGTCKARGLATWIETALPSA